MTSWMNFFPALSRGGEVVSGLALVGFFTIQLFDMLMQLILWYNR